MKKFFRIHFWGMALIASLIISPSTGMSQTFTQVDLTIVPKSPPPECFTVRLLPAEFELEEGNAAPVLLRMPWEANAFMESVYPMLDDYAKMEIDDPKIKELSFDSFADTMKRAAFMKDANWEYETDSEQPFLILLPDVQGMRQFVGHGMTAWIKQKLSRDDVMGACEGVQIQLGCARHIARTPILVNQLVASLLSVNALDSVERIIQSNDAPNLYYTLAMLPDEIGNLQASLEYESQMLTQSIPSLKRSDITIGGSGWKTVAEEFFSVMSSTGEVKESDVESLLEKLDATSEEILANELKFTPQQIKAMSSQEQIMRVILHTHHKFSKRVQSAFHLPTELIIPRLLEVQEEIQAFKEKAGALNLAMVANGPSLAFSSMRFDRRVKALQVVESIRDFVAKHPGTFPKSLNDLDLPAPKDPFTGKPFEYVVEGDTAKLSMAVIEPSSRIHRFEYLIKIAKK